ncbi:MAG: TauD/TfdA family dioxygenase, partial [Paraburkholderia fungorum]|nr:TauD/TfdA family dioxygenase [Paraburkholderia fungorum]
MSAAALQETQSIQVNPLSAHIGAEIHGVDLTRKLDARQIAEIRAALL